MLVLPKDVLARSLDWALAFAASDLPPPDRLSTAAYAGEKRFVQAPGGGRGAKWENSRTPYLVAPMNSLDDPRYRTVAISGPGQCGKTEIAQNWMLKSVASDQGNILWYMQSDDALESFVKDRINPMIDDHDELASVKGPRAIDDSLHYKRFRGMSVQFLTASMNNLISKSAPRIVADEIDAYRDIFGDVKVLLDIRRQAYGDQSKLLIISHPDRAKGMVPERDWTQGVMSVYADSTRCMWWWKCPKCGGYSSPAPLATRYMSIEYPKEGSLDDVEKGAFLLCPINGCHIKEKQRVEMNAHGVWVGRGQEVREDGKIEGELAENLTAGYWIVGAMSPWIMGGIGALARARVKAERENEIVADEKSDESLRQVIVKQWGFPYVAPRSFGSIDANDVADRAEKTFDLGTVPEGVRFLTCAVDCQGAYFEFLVRGWGVSGESWMIDRGKMLAEPATSPKDWDGLVELFSRAYPLADGSGRTMVIHAAGYDSAGLAGVTQQAYSAWKRWRASRIVKFFGKIGGRDAWSVIPLRGSNGLNAQRLTTTYPDTTRKQNLMAGRGEVPVGAFNPNLFKDDLAGQLMRGEPGPWFIHFPYKMRHPEPPHYWFEQLVAETRRQDGRWINLQRSRNEALDLSVMTHVIAHLHGLPRINWKKPPAWASDWDVNPLVSKPRGSDGAKQAAEKREEERAVKITIDQPTKKSIASKLA